MRNAQQPRTKPRAIGYVRVSTDKQADRGVSLEAQQEKVRAMAAVQGADLLEVLVDAGESAKSLQRPAMAKLLALVDSHKVDTVIVAKLDRLTRSVKDLAELLERFQRRGVSLVSVAESLDTASAAGRLVLNIMASVSQWEREAIGERTAVALAHKRAASRVFNHAPYGYRRDGDSLVPVPGEQEIIGQMLRLRGAGYSLRRIAGELNAAGVPTKNGGKQWASETVRNVLKGCVGGQAAA